VAKVAAAPTRSGQVKPEEELFMEPQLSLEPLLTLKQVAAYFPSRSKSGHISINTVLNYTNKGVRIGNQVVKLEPTYTPSGRRFTESAIKKFLDEIKAAKEALRNPPAPTSARLELIRRGVFKPDPNNPEEMAAAPPQRGKRRQSPAQDSTPPAPTPGAQQASQDPRLYDASAARAGLIAAGVLKPDPLPGGELATEAQPRARRGRPPKSR
jgi:hypothetical protein